MNHTPTFSVSDIVQLANHQALFEVENVRNTASLNRCLNGDLSYADLFSTDD